MGKLQKVQEALELSADTFRRYQKLHSQKGTPDADTKAALNSLLADEMEASLAALNEFMEKNDVS